mmetsp:Transcript_4392/g.6333  ORF Transcript_4392/g.6333 Transcript_4392/m.6333 type:complete len:295 (+) Transcript_4392:34-918(+)
MSVRRQIMKISSLFFLCAATLVKGQGNGCSVCGEGKIVTKIDTVFDYPGEGSIACGSLEQVGRMGFIPREECDHIPGIADVCGCAPDTTRFPTPEPTPKPATAQPTPRDDAPSPSPSETPTEMPFLTRAPTPPTLPFTRRPRCGESWQDANHNCYDFCERDEDCKAANRKKPFCYRDLPNVCRVKTLMRCGVDWSDANTRCTSTCTKENEALQCPWGQRCYSDVADICHARCGYTWDTANESCANPCRTLDKKDCPSGQQCFMDMVKECSGATQVRSWQWHIALCVALLGMFLM